MTDPDSALPALFEPFELRDLRFGNRVVVTPMCQYIADDGHIADWHFAHHGRFALGGVGGALVEATGVTREGRITPGCLGIYLDSHVDGLSRITDLYHRHDVPVGIQIGHAGRKGSAAVPLEGAQPLTGDERGQAWTIVGPSAIAQTDGWPVPHELSGDEINSLIEAFAVAAKRAVAARFDFVEIHGAHGYLINTFFSPLANQRDDEWGGDRDARMRFPLAVADAIRAVIPPGMPLLYRTSVVDGIDGGVTIEDTVVLAQNLKQHGVDLVDCSSGGMVGASGRAAAPPAPGYLVPYAKAVREGAGIPTMAVGLIVEAQQANDVVANGSADLVAMGRQLLDDPNFVLHAAQALNHPDPYSLIPESYAFFLSRRKLS